MNLFDLQPFLLVSFLLVSLLVVHALNYFLDIFPSSLSNQFQYLATKNDTIEQCYLIKAITKYLSPKRYKLQKQSAEDDVIDGDKQEFNDVSDASHNGESQSARLGDLFEF